MPYDPRIHHRRSIRLRGYDYAQAGLYFVTIVVKNRETIFGEVLDGLMRANEAGRIVEEVWGELPVHFPSVDTDAFVLMPNHIHGIVIISEPDAVGAGSPCPSPHPAPDTVGAGFPRPVPPPAFEETPAVGGDEGEATSSQRATVAVGEDRGGETPGEETSPLRANVAVGGNEGGETPGGETRGGETPGEETSPLRVFAGRPTLGQVVAYLKYQSAKRINAIWGTPGDPLWQRNYYEHIVRSERELEHLRRYIDENPERWDLDDENPARVRVKAGQ